MINTTICSVAQLCTTIQSMIDGLASLALALVTLASNPTGLSKQTHHMPSQLKIHLLRLCPQLQYPATRSNYTTLCCTCFQTPNKLTNNATYCCLAHNYHPS